MPKVEQIGTINSPAFSFLDFDNKDKVNHVHVLHIIIYVASRLIIIGANVN